jgi:hypothetical protein
VRIETPSALPADMAEDFLKIYRAAFEPMEVLAAARQSLTDEEFLDELAHPDVFKWVAWDEFDTPCAMAFMATELSLMPWISIPYYKARFPEHYERKAIYYFGGLLVHPDYQGSSAAVDLIAAVVAKIGADNAIAAFDCCQFNVDRRFPQMIADVAARVCVSVDPQVIDHQTYFAYDMRGVK